MERDVRQKLVAIGVLAVVLGLAAQADSQNLAAKINAYLKPFVEANNFIGIIHISRGDSVLFQKGYGLANYELNVPNEPETRFHIASITKAFTAAADSGRLFESDCHVASLLATTSRLGQAAGHTAKVPVT